MYSESKSPRDAARLTVRLTVRLALREYIRCGGLADGPAYPTQRYGVSPIPRLFRNARS